MVNGDIAGIRNPVVNYTYKNDKAKIYLGSSIAGMTRVIVGFPLEHPIDAIKVQW